MITFNIFIRTQKLFFFGSLSLLFRKFYKGRKSFALIAMGNIVLFLCALFPITILQTHTAQLQSTRKIRDLPHCFHRFALEDVNRILSNYDFSHWKYYETEMVIYLDTATRKLYCWYEFLLGPDDNTSITTVQQHLERIAPRNYSITSVFTEYTKLDYMNLENKVRKYWRVKFESEKVN